MAECHPFIKLGNSRAILSHKDKAGTVAFFCAKRTGSALNFKTLPGLPGFATVKEAVDNFATNELEAQQLLETYNTKILVQEGPQPETTLDRIMQEVLHRRFTSFNPSSLCLSNNPQDGGRNDCSTLRSAQTHIVPVRPSPVDAGAVLARMCPKSLEQDSPEILEQDFRMETEEAALSLLDLPDPCLLAVLQCCAADSHVSLFSAARSHSRLHQAATAALRSLTAVLHSQQHVDSVMEYLGKHGQLVHDVDLKGMSADSTVLRQLPSNLQLHSLQLEDVCVQLQAGADARGVLGGAAGAAALKQLRLKNCNLHASEISGGPGPALSLLPAGLEHLSISKVKFNGHDVTVPTAALQHLRQLSFLEIAGVDVEGPDETSLGPGGFPLQGPGQRPVMQPMQGLTRLVDLRLKIHITINMPEDTEIGMEASMLSGMQHLTRLELPWTTDGVRLEPRALAGKTKLRHLHLNELPGGAAGVAQLLLHLQDQQQLTHLELEGSLWAAGKGRPPAAAYAALTASSTLQHLDVSSSWLPAGVWQHAFPAGRQLPHLRFLKLSSLTETRRGYLPAPEGSRLVSCCPSLQQLVMCGMKYSAELLPALQALSGLQTLNLSASEDTPAEALRPVCQLTGLRELTVYCASQTSSQGLQLLNFTWMQQLTMLTYPGCSHEPSTTFTSTTPDDEPVWRQVLRLHLNHSNPEVAQQAAAALAE